jgi:hypothetical protein
LDDGKIDASDEDGIKNDCTLFHDSATAGPDSMVVQVDRVNADTVQVDLDGGPGMPLSMAAQVFATLDWDFTITIDTSSGMPEWTLTGKHDGFPAYELYINDTEIYRYSPGPAPYSFFTQVRKLLPPLDVKVGNLSGPCHDQDLKANSTRHRALAALHPDGDGRALHRPLWLARLIAG